MQALKSRKESCMHAYATEMRPKSLHGDSVEGLFEIYETSVQSGRVAWLDGVGSVLQVPEVEHGL